MQIHEIANLKKFKFLKNSKVQNFKNVDSEKHDIFRISRISEMDSAYKNEPKTVFGVNGLFKLS